ncbi:MAG: DUF302 domain-containing protein [Flavobacteriales bacterium]|jgi:uncharacterized protein (DUF302 family)|nr:DUF302 domain-containing protein [Flavobacteriales bacterium]
MKYYLKTLVTGQSYDEVRENLIAEMKKEGFGVLTEANLQAAFKEKLGLDYRKYEILGACNPRYAYKALEIEDKLGVYLPCNFIIQEMAENTIEVAAVNPIVMMSTIDNELLKPIAKDIYDKMKRIIDSL